jgi:hypothetical protein
MKTILKKTIIIFMGAFISCVIFYCTAGPESDYALEAAGFWAGLWHGLISFFTFIISLFTDSVKMYEVNNVGTLYDFGFILGIWIFYGSGGGGFSSKIKKSKAEKEWDEIGKKFEEKIRLGIKAWCDEAGKDKDWEEIGREVEEKIKKELKNWAKR